MTSVTINANRLTSSGKLDSSAAPDGSPKMTVIRSDQFENGVDTEFWSNSENVVDAQWSTNIFGGNSTGKVEFRFAGGSSTVKQQTFHFSQTYDHVAIEWDLYVPLNYSHTNNGYNPTANNKLLRLYQTSYGDVTHKVGASMDPNAAADGGSSVYVEAVGTGGVGTGRRGVGSDNFITLADRGTWIRIKFEAYAATVGGNIDINTGDGRIYLYKNDVLMASATDVPSSVGGDQGFQTGYMMGASNSGFLTQTILAMDNVVMRGE